MYIKYTWLLRQEKNYRQIRLLTWTSFISQFVHPVGEEKLDGVKRVEGENVILAHCMFYFIR